MDETKGFLYRFGKAMRSIVAAITVTMSFGYLYLLMFKAIPEQNKEIINIATGLVLAALGGVINYYFGSSKDSSDTSKVTNAVAMDAAKN